MDIKSVLQDISEQEGIVDSYVAHPWKTGDGQGYLADIKIVYVEGKSKNGAPIILSFVLKVAATNQKLRECSSVALVFGCEIFMYTAVFSEYQKFEKIKGIKQPFACVPKCYYVSSATIPEVLIMENLQQSGYRVWNRKLQMGDEHVRIVMEEYGRFHAVSFAIQDQKPELFLKLTKNYDNVFAKFMEKSGFVDTVVNKARKAKAALDPEIDKDAMKKYTAFLDGAEETFRELMFCTEKYYVILHSDCWSNNILFKYGDLDSPEQPTGIRLIDFQLSKLGSPAWDLAYFFYPCVLKEVLNNANVYKRVYYDSFAAHLIKLGSDPEKVYPYSVFEQHWRKYSQFGLIMSSLLNYTLLTEENEITDFTTIIESGTKLSDAFNYEIANIDKYNERMRTIILHCVNNNYI